ncbi:hypothetical protein GCK32_007297 [Trichostrongylus colubriformis]|uniref:C2H2-type domain-containing protein n=1 Tax=Trichostrongylus colubriformis TaxID=6319 RepID=A0AAN8IES4_TRICO
MVSVAEADMIDEIDGLMEPCSATGSDGVIKPVASASLMNSSSSAVSKNGVDSSGGADLPGVSSNGSGQTSTEILKESLQCEFCCLTLRSHASLEMHLKFHTEFPSFCYLCDCPVGGFEKPELLLQHVKAHHTLPVDPSKQDGNLYVVCAFCNFQVRKNQFMAHLISDCYMAPCPLCGDKLIRRNDRVNHRRIHKDVSERFVCECRRGYATITAFNEHICRSKPVPVVSCRCCSAKFISAQSGSCKATKDATTHFIKKHTKNLYCLPCKNEPLIALSEHAQNHLKESSEISSPKPALHSCSVIGLLDNTIEFPQIPLQCLKPKKSSHNDSEQDLSDATETTDNSSSPVASTAMVEASGDDELSRHRAWEGEVLHQSECSNSRDGNSPSLLEKQRQVLAEALDDFGPPPSVIVIENETAVVREEREETPSAVPKSSVADDSDDEILIVGAMKESHLIQRASSSSAASPVVHYVNEGDDDCMMLDVLELPTGVTSQSVSGQREKKFKCSMCSETFLRQSTCRYHEQTSHRNDIISDICDEVYGIPLMADSLMYLCQQCAIAYEDQQRAHRHRAQHMIKAPAFPCEKCSSICLTDSNLREHHKKHDEGKLSYRCLKCTPNRIFSNEYAIFFHLYTEHSTPIIAFCKNCLVASANLDRIFSHTVYRECSGSRATNPRITMITIQRSLGFAVASDLYYQPADEKQHKQADGQYAIPSLCSHRSFITFGDAFTTCPEDPLRCAALVNQNRWHSHLCATNKESPGEMPRIVPEGILMKTVGADNMVDMLISRFKFKESRNLPPAYHEPSPSSSSKEITAMPSVSPSRIDQRRQNAPISTCEVLNRRRSNLVEPRSDHPAAAPMPSTPPQMYPGGPVSDMPTLRASVSTMPGHIATNQINSQLLLDNFHSGRLYPDPASVAVLAPLPPPVLTTSRPTIPASSNSVAQPVVQRCVVCDLVTPAGSCKATSFYVDYMVAVPVNPLTLKEQWAMNICRYLTNPVAQDILNGFRLCHQPRLCLRHFNPRTVTMSQSGVLMRSSSCGNDMPILDFAQFASLNLEFNQALSKLLDGMEKCQNSNTIAMMLKIVQELVKCSDERCGRSLNSSNDVRLHRFHQSQNKFVCMECFSTTDVIRTEQEMIEHFALKHSQRNREGGENKIQVVYTLHCPLRNCNGAFPSVQMLRKHINHIHSAQFPMSSDNCATRFCNAAKMTFHNGVHEKHSCDVTCCYLCGVADPWQRELPGGLKISHELVHAMKRFVACKTCMAPMGQDPTGVTLIDHFMRQHMLDQPRRVRHCKVCRQNVIEPGIAEHILEQHRLVAFRPRYAPQSNMVSVMNGSELCVYLGVPTELCKPNPLADSSELG